MKTILCTHYGPPDDLVLADIAEPVAGPGEVVVKVAAVGLNFFDTLIIAGKYQRKPPFPFSPGGEFAGVVERTGAGVDGFAPGDRVLGYVTFGAARERVAAAGVFDFESDFEAGFPGVFVSAFASALSPPAATSKPMMKETSLRTPSAGRSEMKA